MSEELRVLNRLPNLVKTDPEIYAVILDIYNAINNLARKVDSATSFSTDSQADREQMYLQGNLNNCLLAQMSRKLWKFSSDAVHGDIISIEGNVQNKEVSSTFLSSSNSRSVLGMCLDTVAAGDYGYVYTKGLVKYTRQTLVPGRLYGAITGGTEDPTPANRNVLYGIQPIDVVTGGVSYHTIGIALRSDILLLNCQQWG